MSDSTIDIGRVGVWYGMIDTLPTPEAQRAAQKIEELGYGALWIAEAVGRDPFVSASLLLSATTRLPVATGIANIYARDPMAMAAAQKTLAEAFPNRFLLGLGVSHGDVVTNLRNHDWSKPYSTMVSYLEAMDNSLFLAVGPSDPPPRVLAALGPKMLALSATQGLGAHPYFTTTAHTEFARDVIGPDAVLAPEQMVVLETDPTEARRIAREGMATYISLPNYVNNLKRFGFEDDDFTDGGSDRLVDAVVAWGSADDIAARVSEHHTAGANHVSIQVLHDGLHFPQTELETLASVLL